MGLFGKKKDWNVVAVLFESKGKYSVNGNRARGAAAETVRDGAKAHKRTIFWAVFDQKRSFLEGQPGPGANDVPREVLTKLMRDLPKLPTIRDVLSTLESGATDKVAKTMQWKDEPA